LPKVTQNIIEDSFVEDFHIL